MSLRDDRENNCTFPLDRRNIKSYCALSRVRSVILNNDHMRIDEFVKRFGKDAVVYPYGAEDDSCAAIAGHWLYVRKCVRKSPKLETPEGETELVLPEKSQNQCNWFEIVAKGIRVGKKRRWSKKKRRDMGDVPLCIVDAFDIGDRVLFPPNHWWGIKHSPADKNEFLMDEFLAIAKYED